MDSSRGQMPPRIARLPRDPRGYPVDVEPERPELFVAVAGERVEVMPQDGPLPPYVRPSRPHLAVEYWRHGERLEELEGRRMAAEAMERRRVAR